MIPPSIGLVLLGSVLGVSTGDLFLAAIVPGLICMACLCVTCYFWCLGKKEIKLSRTYSWEERRQAIIKALPTILMPLVIIGSLWGGICTPSEAGGLSCIVGIILAKFYFHNFGWSELKQCIENTAKTTASIFCVILAAIVFGRVLSSLFVPQSVAKYLNQTGLGLTAFRLAFFGMFFILGMLFDATPLILVVLPPLLPTLLSYPDIGNNLVAFGVAFQLIVNIGQITPPVSVTLYASAAAANADVPGTIREILPFLLTTVFVTFLILFLPSLGSIY
jgi:C4-dicarboxylate transporter DctM subunit